jgi:hypothetical protein
MPRRDTPHHAGGHARATARGWMPLTSTGGATRIVLTCPSCSEIVRLRIRHDITRWTPATSGS